MDSAITGNTTTKKRALIGLSALFFTQFVIFLFNNARNIAQPAMIQEFNGMPLFSWLIALPALSGAAATLLSGRLSDMFGRRTLLLITMGTFFAGLVITAFSHTMLALIISTTFMSIGHFPIVPLLYSAIGDIFPPNERASWTGLLNIPIGLASALGPFLGGLVTESSTGWRGLFWGMLPLLLLCAALVFFGMPAPAERKQEKVDIAGTIFMLIASSTLIFGLSFIGTPGWQWIAVGLLLLSVLAWAVFLRIEKHAEAPILDYQVLFNRTFITAAVSGTLGFFGILAIIAYSPILVQNVMGISPSLSGSMLTPYSVILPTTGVLAGLFLARRHKYKVLYIVCYAVAALSMVGVWQFNASTPVWWYILVTSFGALGLGAVGTVSTLVAQFAVPPRLLGVAVGALFFFQMIGIAIAPPILGLVQNSAPTLEAGLKLVFLVGLITMLAALLLIITIPEHSSPAEE